MRQQLVRGGGAGTNRKSNDAERLHDESANRLWSILDENRNIFNEFVGATKPYYMEWHHLYYKEVSDSLFKKLTTGADAEYKDSSVISNMNGSNYKPDRTPPASTERPENDTGDDFSEAASRSTVSSVSTDTKFPNGISGKRMGDTTSSNISQGVDILSAIQDSRNTFAEGITKRVPINIGLSSSIIDMESTGTNKKYDTFDGSNKAARNI